MKKLKSIVSGMLLVVMISGINLSCARNNSKDGVPDNTTLSPEKPTPMPNPSPDDSLPEENNDIEDEKTNYQWHYKGAINEFTPVSEIKDCPSEFIVEGICKEPLNLCKRKINIYACYPENLEVHITGKVIDENENPIENVKINGSLGYEGYEEIATAYSKKNGKFILKIPNFCVPMIHAMKDSYTSGTGRPYSAILTKCQVSNFMGAKNIVIRLKKAERTISNLAQPISEPNKCRIVGKVFDSEGKGLIGVTVRNGKFSVESDNEGNYILEKNEKCTNYCMLSKTNFNVLFPEGGKRIAMVSCFQGQPANVIFKSN